MSKYDIGSKKINVFDNFFSRMSALKKKKKHKVKDKSITKKSK